MISSTILITLLLLGYAQGGPIAVEFEVAQDTPFETTIDPAFAATSVTLNDTNAELPACTATTKDCCTKMPTSLVEITIEDKTLWESVQFLVGTDIKATITIADLEAGKPASPVTPAPQAKSQTNKIDKKVIKVPCVPGSMMLVKKNARSAPDNNEVKVSDTCPATSNQNPNGCIMIKDNYYPVYVKADMQKVPRLLTITGGEGQKLEATFKPSAASWMSHSVAVILASLAVVHLVQ
ncbi:unnamed protein product [Dibothriocephalus latus]|uniref:Uncharacterized protein n=1 Tax=Dibothriocephalus latus TaxID=60516 RepID=A0A3P6R0V6_DIBLA|nr:unnamed protein product [Dibothriocephalus latus]